MLFKAKVDGFAVGGVVGEWFSVHCIEAVLYPGYDCETQSDNPGIGEFSVGPLPVGTHTITLESMAFPNCAPSYPCGSAVYNWSTTITIYVTDFPSAGSCGSANGVEVSTIPTPTPASTPNNLCSVGTASSVSTNTSSFSWTCNGPDGVPSSPDDVSCSSPKKAASLSCTDQTTMINGTAQAQNGGVYGTPQSIKKIGNYVYAGASGVDNAQGLYIYDVSNPKNIIQTSFFSVFNPETVRINSWGNDVVGLDVSGNYAYLATDYGGLVIVNVSNPSSPSFMSKLQLNNLNGSGAKETWDVQVVGNYAFLAAGKGMIVVDISNKSNPVVVANKDLGASISQEIHVSGNYAYVAMREKGFSVLDITNPLNPTHITTITAGYNASSLAYALEKKGDILYVGDNLAQRVSMYNVSNPAVPALVGSVPVIISEDNGSPRELFIDGNVLYVSAGKGGLYGFDITNPTSPTQLIRINKPPFAANVRVWGIVPLNSPDFTELAVISGDTSVGLYTTKIFCETMPNLISSFTAPVGSFIQDTPITLSGTVTNTATVNTGTGFKDNFSYSWNSGSTWSNLPDINHSVLSAGASENDQTTFTPTQAGTLTLQHCVDSYNEIAEGVNETPNCTQSSVNVVGATLSGVNCSVPNGSNTCDSSFTWKIEGASSPNLYNENTSIQYSTLPEDTNVNYPLQYGANNVRARDGVTTLKLVTVTAQCNAASYWDGDSCEITPIPPIINITANPKIIRIDQTAPISISIKAGYGMKCTLSGVNLTPIDLVHTASEFEKTYNYTTRPLKSTQMVNIACTDGGTIKESREVRVEVIGNVQET